MGLRCSLVDSNECIFFLDATGFQEELDVYDLDYWRERLMEERLGLKEERLGMVTGATRNTVEAILPRKKCTKPNLKSGDMGVKPTTTHICL